MTKRLIHVFAAGCLLVLGASAALAGPADDAIKGRQACMKGNGAMMKVLVPMVKGEKPYDAAAVKAAIDETEKGCADWAKWWGPDTQKGETLKTEAKAEIWSDAKGFEAAGMAYVNAMGALKASTDEASFKAAFGPVGGACKGCHEKFRQAD